jgi:response regulator RpfG family c-di-GMP phosphodiesterase
MWNTILSKKPWYGIVKNKKKDGGEYIVEVTINPILNHDGEIEEFIAIRNDITNVVKLHEDLEHTQEDLIYRMGEIGETRSQETGFHVKRVAKYSELLAHYYGLSPQEIQYLRTASPMHDIGKVGIPDSILNKPGKLTNDEWRTMKTHANIGYELFRDSDKPLLQTAAIIAYEHHEKWDGTGYPRGLQGENIHIYGRITAVADVFDALGSDRCYKQAWEDERIFKLLKEERGKHFDPKLIDIFFDHLDEFLRIRDHYKDTSSFMQE